VTFALPDEIEQLRDSVRRLTSDVIAPRAGEIDETNVYPEDFHTAFVTAGLAGLAVPEEYGGAGAGVLGLTVAIEEVAKQSSVAGLMLLLTRLPVGPILISGTEDQRQRYVRGLAEGRLRASFGLSEPQAGSDVMGMRTTAVRDGDGWRLSGTKCWMSGVDVADWYVVFAKTGPVASRDHDSVSAFVVERSSEGLSVGPFDRKMGVRGVNTGQLHLDRVWVPRENVVGEVGGFRTAMRNLNSMRPIVAARGLGLAEGALRYAMDYVKERPAFGQTVADFQGIRWKVAELATEIEAARLLTYRAAMLVDAGQVDKHTVPLLSMAKYYATEVAVKVSGEALQLLGAAGYMKDHPVEMHYRDAKQLTIVEGTTQIQLGLIGRGVLDGTLSW